MKQLTIRILGDHYDWDEVNPEMAQLFREKSAELSEARELVRKLQSEVSDIVDKTREEFYSKGFVDRAKPITRLSDSKNFTLPS